MNQEQLTLLEKAHTCGLINREEARTIILRHKNSAIEDAMRVATAQAERLYEKIATQFDDDLIASALLSGRIKPVQAQTE